MHNTIDYHHRLLMTSSLPYAPFYANQGPSRPTHHLIGSNLSSSPPHWPPRNRLHRQITTSRVRLAFLLADDVSRCILIMHRLTIRWRVKRHVIVLCCLDSMMQRDWPSSVGVNALMMPSRLAGYPEQCGRPEKPICLVVRRAHTGNIKE